MTPSITYTWTLGGGGCGTLAWQTDRQTETDFYLIMFQLLELWVWSIGGMIVTGKLKYSENLFQYHFVHHKYNMGPVWEWIWASWRQWLPLFLCTISGSPCILAECNSVNIIVFTYHISIRCRKSFAVLAVTLLAEKRHMFSCNWKLFKK
jgi:hypothetical protein